MKGTHRSSLSLKSTRRSTSLADRLTCHSVYSPACDVLLASSTLFRKDRHSPVAGNEDLTLSGMPASSAMRIHQLLLIGKGTRHEW